MKFYDQVTITIQSGKGGDGSAAGRREAKVPRGGPAGGDGGKGGSIIFRACQDEWTLMPYRYKRMFTADFGNPGQSRDKYGADASDIELLVPVGTLIKDPTTGYILTQLTQHNQTRIGAKGGKGGRGNIHFKNAQSQFPSFALYGEPGEKKELILELQLLADVALIGTPSVGKSTLINAVSGVKAKTAAYHFTTLVPNIGVVEHKGKSFTMIDVPGLIEGAAQGKGLGNEFLRHILKARIFAIFVDITKDLPGINEAGKLLDEIMLYVEQRLIGSYDKGIHITSIKQEIVSENDLLHYRVWTIHEGKDILLLDKALLFVVSKIDALLDPELRQEYSKHLQEFLDTYMSHLGVSTSIHRQHNLQLLSSMSREGIDQFLDQVIYKLPKIISQHNVDDEHDTTQVTPQHPIYSVEDTTEIDLPILLQKEYISSKKAESVRIWTVVHQEICYLTFVLPRGNDEAQLRYRQHLAQDGHLKPLIKAGAKKGDILKIISLYPGQPDKYILRE